MTTTAPFYNRIMIVTTVDQSRQLLNAGYKRDTADMRYAIVNDVSGNACPAIDFGPCKKNEIPAWSLSALWLMCRDLPLAFVTCDDRPEDIMDLLVEHLIRNGNDTKGSSKSKKTNW